MQRHWRDKKDPEDPDLLALRMALRQQVYKCVRFEEETLSRVYDQHHRDVEAFFRPCPEEGLLVLNLIAGEGWKKLCRLLERPVPDMPFPHKGSSP